jgi:hypothetical protein
MISNLEPELTLFRSEIKLFFYIDSSSSTALQGSTSPSFPLTVPEDPPIQSSTKGNTAGENGSGFAFSDGTAITINNFESNSQCASMDSPSSGTSVAHFPDLQVSKSSSASSAVTTISVSTVLILIIILF